MNKYISLIILMCFLSFSTYAKKVKWVKETVLVSGNCDMCKEKIESAAKSIDGVKSAKWNSYSEKLKLKFNSELTSTNVIEKEIANIGYDTQNFKASDKSYNNLHFCCKYERKLHNQ